MNWEAFGAIGEVVGAGAVVVTLLLLVSQMRQNTKSMNEARRATESQLYQFRAQMHMDGVLRKADAFGFNLVEVNAKIQDGGIESLTEPERLFLVFHATADAVRLDNGLYQHQNGFMDDDYVAYIKNSIRLLGPYWREIALFERGSFRQGFVNDANRIWDESDVDG